MRPIFNRPSVKYNVTESGQGIAKVSSRGMVINMPVNPVAIEELMEDRKLAVLATVGKDGAPHLTAMWFGGDGKNITFWADTDAIKTRNIRKNNRVSVLVFKDQDGHAYIRLDGTASIDESNVKQEAYAIAGRYMGRQEATGYVDQYGPDFGVIIKVTPLSTYTWCES